MSLKQTEEITIWAFKDGKKGHEKQIDALISELSLFKEIKYLNLMHGRNMTQILTLSLELETVRTNIC